MLFRSVEVCEQPQKKGTWCDDHQTLLLLQRDLSALSFETRLISFKRGVPWSENRTSLLAHGLQCLLVAGRFGHLPYKTDFPLAMKVPGQSQAFI